MISGIVINRHATVKVVFRLDNQPNFSIDFVIDTGFTDYLCLPLEAIEILGLPFQYHLPAKLADNSEVLLSIYEATILWNEEEQEVPVVATRRQPLLGTALLSEHELVIQFTEGGLVTIDIL